MFSKNPFLEFGQMRNGNRRQIAESIGAGELSEFTLYSEEKRQKFEKRKRRNQESDRKQREKTKKNI